MSVYCIVWQQKCIGRDATLRELKFTDESGYNSSKVCLSGTWKELIGEIMDWYGDVDGAWQEPGSLLLHTQFLISVTSCQSMTLCIELHTFPMHLWSSSAYSDTLHIRLCMLCDSTPPPPCLCMCHPYLFVCLPLSLVHMLLICLFVSINWWAVDQC